ncbi:DUF1801 domain-containing protein [Tamlana agarivorans]|uniref:DUF1801 domain-containing protein n=1 Tax=Pseudotamlana agarivorans TaxID=481183 RepID=A0ACC5UAI3_9FLAO|nr:DUF1801 domain-containing protein [Tamlana agarivorans]MBU2951348.1 DUF1801 domain-containing protein [Tamlana agarivorans]
MHNNTFYFKKEEPIKSCVLAMRDILLQFDESITETTKYGMPCFCYKGKMFCYIWTDKKTLEPYYLIVEGNRIEHPQLETGNRSRMKIFRINPHEDLPIDTINTILNLALDLYNH